MSTPKPQEQTSPTKKTPGRGLYMGLLALLALAAIVGLIAGWFFTNTGPSGTPGADGQELPWETDDQSPTYQIQQLQGAGLKLADAAGQPIVDLSLSWKADYGPPQGEEGCAASKNCTSAQSATLNQWTHTQQGDTHVFAASHKGPEASLDVTWTFRPGDPRVGLDVTVTYTQDTYPDLEHLTFELLERPAVLGRDLKFATVAPNKTVFSDRSTPHRLIAGSAERALQWTAQGFDAMQVTGTNTGALVTLELDDARNHPARGCDGEQHINEPRQHRLAGTKRQFSGQIWVGHTWGPLVTRWPEGRQAALALLDDSQALDDARLGALMWGHSNLDDPRYGNGGLLGHGLQGTVTLPGLLPASLVKMATDAQELGIDFALRAPAAAASKGLKASTWSADPAQCPTTEPQSGTLYRWSGMSSPPEQDNLNLLRPARRQDRAVVFWPHNRAGQQEHLFRTLSVDGGLLQLRRNITPKGLERLLKERGITILRTSMADPGNSPLGDGVDNAIQEGKAGHFSTAPKLETLLLDLKMPVEDGKLWATSVSSMGQRLEAISKIQVSPQADGRIMVTNTTDAPIKGMTLSLPGYGYSVEVDGKSVAQQRVLEMSRGQRETWVWFDLPASKSALVTVNDDKGYRLQPLIPVRWKL